MNDSEIKATFVAMVNGEKPAKTINGRNNLHILKRYNCSNGVSLYSYSTPIAVYDGEKVVLNCSYFSNSTAKHQSGLRGFNCPVAEVYNFAVWGGTESALLEQAAPLYGWRRVELTASNGRRYTRFELFKQLDLNRADTIWLHRYTKEQAAKDEAARLNSLAYSWSAQG